LTYQLPGAQDDRDEALRLGGLRRLVDEDGLELGLGEARVAGAHARAAHHVRGAEQLALALALQRPVALLVRRAQLARLVLQLLQLLQLRLPKQATSGRV